MLNPRKFLSLWRRNGDPTYDGMAFYQYPDAPTHAGFTHGDIHLRPDPRDPSYRLDTAVGGVGSSINLLPEIWRGVKERKLQCHSINQIAGASAGSRDGDELLKLLKSHPRYRLSEGKGRKPSRHWLFMESPHVNYIDLAEGKTTGMGSDQVKGADSLYSNLTLREGLIALPEAIATSFHEHRRFGGKLAWIDTFGGHSPLNDYARELTLEKVDVTFLVELMLVPQVRGELLSTSYARAAIWHRVARSLNKKEKEEKKKELVITVQNAQRGVHETTDPVLADSLISLLAPAPLGSALDGDSILNTLYTFSCGWIEAVPTYVDTPMAISVDLDPREPAEWGQWRLTAAYGDHTLDTLSDRIGRLLAKAPLALHCIVVNGFFPTEEEVGQLKRMIDDRARLVGTEVIPVVNQQSAPYTHRNLLRYGVTDYIAAAELPLPLFSPYRSSMSNFTRQDSLSPDDFLQECRPSDEELDKVRKVEELISHLA